MWSNDMRREAMARARDTGTASTSGIITLVQETKEDIQKGFLTYLPLYQKDLPLDTVKNRRKAFIGWVYSPFRMGNLMAGILGSEESQVEYKIFDGDVLSKDTLLYDSDKKFQNDKNLSSGLPKATTEIEIQGRKWTLIFTVGKGQLRETESNQPTIIAVAGLTVNFLLFYIISSLTLLQRRAEKLAREMTAELREAKDKLEINNQQLSASNDELSKFAYVASHDLQEPLRMVTSFCNLLKEEHSKKLDETAIEYIDFAVDGALRMKALIRGLLAYSRVGQEDLAPKTVNCEAIMETTLLDLKSTIEESEATITSGPLPIVMADPVLLLQLFENLTQNAIKFRGEAAPIVHISAAKKGDEWLFSFADNGIGISLEYSDQIFIIFKRLHGRDKYDGNGMGLAVCKKIVDRHHGRIWAKPNDGQGSIFYFALPVSKEII